MTEAFLPPRVPRPSDRPGTSRPGTAGLYGVGSPPEGPLGRTAPLRPPPLRGAHFVGRAGAKLSFISRLILFISRLILFRIAVRPRLRTSNCSTCESNCSTLVKNCSTLVAHVNQVHRQLESSAFEGTVSARNLESARFRRSRTTIHGDGMPCMRSAVSTRSVAPSIWKAGVPTSTTASATRHASRHPSRSCREGVMNVARSFCAAHTRVCAPPPGASMAMLSVPDSPAPAAAAARYP
eukprot:1014230-Prorocentrum_minimum.AAC.5